MSTGVAQDVVAEAPGSAPRRYGALVWARMQRTRGARLALRTIAGLVGLAVAAPLVSLDQPLLWRDAHGLSSPFAFALVNRLLFESGVDLFFNLALLFAPLYALIWAIARRRDPARLEGRRGRLSLLLFVAHAGVFALASPPALFGVANPLHREAPIVDWAQRISEAEARGERVQAIFPLQRWGYRRTDAARGVEPPSAAHWLGTDREGRDVLARLVYGTRTSLSVGVVAVGLTVGIGVLLGALAGYLGGRVDLLVSRAIEVMICLPTFFLVLALVAMVEQRSVFHVMAILGITGWTGVARLVRAELLRQRGLEYVQAAVALGLPTRRILFGHVLPNAMGPVLVSATFGVAGAILTESSLAFLGLGDTTLPSWGALLDAGRVEGKPWLVLAPGAAIFLVVCVFNLAGEALRDALDPRHASGERT